MDKQQKKDFEECIELDDIGECSCSMCLAHQDNDYSYGLRLAIKTIDKEIEKTGDMAQVIALKKIRNKLYDMV